MPGDDWRKGSGAAISTPFFKLAWRNLGRNRRRTLITASALAVGTMLCVGAYGIMDGMSANMLHSLTRLDLGHLQVHNAKYPKRQGQKYTLSDPRAVIEALKQQQTVQAITARVYGQALLSKGDKSSGVRLIGVQPRSERQVTDLYRRMISGRFLDNRPAPWPRGRALSRQERRKDGALTDQAEQDVLDELDRLGSLASGREPDGPKDPAATTRTPPPSKRSPAPLSKPAGALSRRLADAVSPPPARPPQILLGATLAKVLRVKVGDTLFAMTYTIDGVSEQVQVKVVGIYQTGTAQYDRGRAYLHIADLQRLTHLYHRVHEVAAIVGDPQRASQTVAALRVSGLFAGGHPLVRSWDQIRPDIQTLLALNDASALILIVIIFIVATLGVVNTMLMAVFERTREFGVLKALGMRARSVVGLVVVETTLMALVAALVGTALGLGLDLYLLHHGIDLSGFTDGFSIGGVGLDPVMRGAITLQGLTRPTMILTLSCFLASFYPAIRAARLRPAVGMREL